MKGHPAVEKAKRLARVAVENGWKGSIEHEDGTTLLKAWRDDEKVTAKWIGNTMEGSIYTFFGKQSELPCAKAVLKVFEGKPDIMMVLKYAPPLEKPTLIEKYRNLPFDWQNDDNNEIIAKVIGKRIHWYSHIANRIYADNVLPPKGKRNHIEIKQINHRKMLNYIGSHAGFSSVMLDTLLKVEG